jgi:hypothetical protein
MIDSTAERLQRLADLEEIRSLAARYALALDSRDIETLVSLFVDDVQLADSGSGRAALATWFDSGLRRFTVSFHLIGNHLIDRVDSDHATGTLYCRAEYQVGDRWIVMPQQYWDRYERRDGVWRFGYRTARAFYAADVLEAPTALPGRGHFAGDGLLEAVDLPEHWASWQQFWSPA